MTELDERTIEAMQAEGWTSPEETAAIQAQVEALESWQAEALLWLRHFEDEGDHTHLGLEEFLAAAQQEQEDE